jgi:hypothetical protein
MHTIQPARSYRATLIPRTVSAADVHAQADAGLLPTIQLKARSAGHAMVLANAVTGLPVLRAERRDEVVA